MAERLENALRQQNPLAKRGGTAPIPIPRALPAGGRLAGGDVLHKALLHARDPGRAVRVVGCQDHAARVLHLHGHRHMLALLAVTKVTEGRRWPPREGERSCHERERMAGLWSSLPPPFAVSRAV